MLTSLRTTHCLPGPGGNQPKLLRRTRSRPPHFSIREMSHRPTLWSAPGGSFWTFAFPSPEFVQALSMSTSLWRTFAPRRFQGDVLFVAANDRNNIATPAQMWQPYTAGRIKTHWIMCKHNYMTQPKALAEIGPLLQSELELCQWSPPPSATNTLLTASTS